MSRVLPFLVICAAAAAACGATNLVANGNFETDADRDGVPDRWLCSGSGAHVAQTLTLDAGPDSARCAKLTCSRFRSGSPAAHAMVAQMGTPVRRGKVYRVAFRARGRAIAGDIVSVALSDTRTWSNCGLQGAFAPGAAWRRYEFLFTASRTCAAESRLQIWYTSTGTLWLDDVSLVEVEGASRRPGLVHSAGSGRNLVPNAGFECGRSGWGSAEADKVVHWGGRMNRLFGTVEKTQAAEGQYALRIDLNPRTQPVSYFDYFDLHRTPIRAPLAGNVGLLAVEPGKRWTFSVSMRAGAPDTPAMLSVRQFNGRAFEKAVWLTPAWRRYALTFTPSGRWCSVLAGPDLRKTAENPKPPTRAVVWLDAMQLERSDRPAAFSPRAAVEFGLATDKTGNVFDLKDPLAIGLSVANAAGEARKAAVDLRLTDFDGKEVWRKTIALSLGAKAAVRRRVVVPPAPAVRGFLRLRAALASGTIEAARTMRLAVIPTYARKDSRFGMNHAYPWDHLLALNRKAGLLWVRDWSLKWQDVEPKKGQFTFEQPDRQIDRPRRQGHHMLCMLPFPSSPWSSSAPAEARRGQGYVQRRAVVAYAPRDLAEFETYVRRTAAHYRRRVTWFQVFNEPLFTSYALPRRGGYNGATLAKYTKAFVRAARSVHPGCKVLGGIGYLRDGQIMQDFEEFFAAGGLAAVDAVDIHHYPRIRPPEFVEALLEQLGALMARHGGRKPLWLTEYGYYADDEPWALPMPHQGFCQPLPDERLQAAYAVRWAVIVLANGVEKVFYHAGTCAGLNRDSLQGVFYEYEGRPHKIYAAQAVLSAYLPPARRFVRKLALGRDVKGYLFGEGKDLLAVVWAVRGAKVGPIRLTAPGIAVRDLMDRPLAGGRFIPTGVPVYLVARGLSAAQFAAALKPTGAGDY